MCDDRFPVFILISHLQNKKYRHSAAIAATPCEDCSLQGQTTVHIVMATLLLSSRRSECFGQAISFCGMLVGWRRPPPKKVLNKTSGGLHLTYARGGGVDSIGFYIFVFLSESHHFWLNSLCSLLSRSHFPKQLSMSSTWKIYLLFYGKTSHDSNCKDNHRQPTNLSHGCSQVDSHLADDVHQLGPASLLDSQWLALATNHETASDRNMILLSSIIIVFNRWTVYHCCSYAVQIVHEHIWEHAIKLKSGMGGPDDLHPWTFIVGANEKNLYRHVYTYIRLNIHILCYAFWPFGNQLHELWKSNHLYRWCFYQKHFNIHVWLPHGI